MSAPEPLAPDSELFGALVEPRVSFMVFEDVVESKLPALGVVALELVSEAEEPGPRFMASAPEPKYSLVVFEREEAD